MKANHKFITRVLDKPDVQKMLKALRKAGLKVEKLDAGYSVTTKQGFEVFKAMNGQRAYLCRFVDNLFVNREGAAI
jgi:5-enolpyruvylshikimate-3-phosphate synthase|tara:strand:- start:177 stop:404 length:228 start_codon:yes stop_codon:yes gene_type:complete